jgi:hypothetical protein
MEENGEILWKIWNKYKLNSEMIWKICKKDKLNSEMIWKIWKKILKRYEKYRRKLRNDMENTEEDSEIFRKYGRKIR